MFNSEQLITDEEMSFLLASRPSPSVRDTPGLGGRLPYCGVVLWLLKVVFLMGLIASPEAHNGVVSSSYWWLRGGLEFVYLVVFLLSASSPRYRNVACASLLMACTSLLMDVLVWVAISA